MRPLALLLCSLVSLSVWAGTAQEMLWDYTAQIRRENPAQRPDAGRGERFFQAVRAGAQGPVACADCHTPNPLKPGKTRAGKEIAPLAPAATPTRFTDPAKSEKWFRRNCGDVLGRECSAQEKADLLAWLLTLQ